MRRRLPIGITVAAAAVLVAGAGFAFTNALAPRSDGAIAGVTSIDVVGVSPTPSATPESTTSPTPTSEDGATVVTPASPHDAGDDHGGDSGSGKGKGGSGKSSGGSHGSDG